LQQVAYFVAQRARQHLDQSGVGRRGKVLRCFHPILFLVGNSLAEVKGCTRTSSFIPARDVPKQNATGFSPALFGTTLVLTGFSSSGITRPLKPGQTLFPTCRRWKRGAPPRQGDDMRQALWTAWAGIVAATLAGCATGPLLENPVIVRPQAVATE